MGWMPKEKYLQALQTMKLGIQVTYAETFDYVVAEHFIYGIPCLVSKTIDWIPRTDVWNDIMIDNFDDPNEIARKIKALMKDEDLRINIGKRCRSRIRLVARRNNDVCVKTLKEILD